MHKEKGFGGLAPASGGRRGVKATPRRGIPSRVYPLSPLEIATPLMICL